jgi:ankyrin repeat protein
LQAGADLRARNVHGTVPLHAAAGNANPAVIAMLLEADADVHVRNNFGRTALHWAARDSYGRTPLHRAVMLNERLPIVAALTGAARCSGFSTRPLAVGRRLAQPRMGDGGSA